MNKILLNCIGIIIVVTAIFLLLDKNEATVIFAPETTKTEITVQKNENDLMKDTDKILSEFKNISFYDLIPDQLFKTFFVDELIAKDFKYLNSQDINLYVAWNVPRQIITPMEDIKHQYRDMVGGENYAKLWGNDNEVYQYLCESAQKGYQIIEELGREYLKNPENLKSLYESKKELLLCEFWNMSDEDIFSFKLWLKNAKSGMEMFNDKYYLSTYQELLKNYNLWINQSNQKSRASMAHRKAKERLIEGLPEGSAFSDQIHNRYISIHYPNMYQLTKITAKIPENRQNLYDEFIEAEKSYIKAGILTKKYYDKFLELDNILTSNSSDPYATFFAGRRYSEGGIELVNAYIYCINDLLQSF